jgi:hypothetical protein
VVEGIGGGGGGGGGAQRVGADLEAEGQTYRRTSL